MNKKLIIGGIILLFVFLGSYLFYSCNSVFSVERHYSDNEMIRLFEKKKSLFDELLIMAQDESGNFRIFQDWSSPDNLSEIGITKERERKYKKLIDKIGLKGIEKEYGSYYFIHTTEGMLDSGSFKGFVYLNYEPKEVYDSLDVRKNIPSDQHAVYRKVFGNWYLYYEDTGD